MRLIKQVLVTTSRQDYVTQTKIIPPLPEYLRPPNLVKW